MSAVPADAADELAVRWAGELAAQLPAAVALRHELHAHPELSGAEEATAERVVAALAGAEPGGPDLAVTRVAGTGRLVRIGPASGPAIAVRAELDALPVQERTGAPWASGVPGVMHACGHDVHLAAAVALGRAARRVHRRRRPAGGLPAALLLVLQPREELNPTGAGDVVGSGLLDRERVRAVLGVHLQPQVPAGRLALDPGVVNAGVDEFTITITGRGGHSAYPHLARDPVPALCQCVLAVREAAAAIDPMRPVVVTVGVLEAGRAPNVIGDEARAAGTVRTVGGTDLARLEERMRAAVAGTAAAFDCTGELVLHPGEPPLRNDPDLVAAVRARWAATPLAHQPALADAEFRSCGSDDFAVYGQALPAAMMFLGVADGSAMLHDARFLPPDRGVGEAATAMLLGYLGALDRLGR